MIRERFGRKRSDPTEHYPWECPHCNMAMTQETKTSLELQGIFEYCPGCGEHVGEE